MSLSFKERISWTLIMAVREGRFLRPRALLFVLTIAIGLASLVASFSFRKTLERELELQAKSLIGADLVLESRAPPSESTAAFHAKLPGERRSEIAFRSMLVAPKSERSRLVQIRGIERGFPFYGALATDPPEALGHIFSSAAIVAEESVLHQLGVEVGDSVTLGSSEFIVAGVLRRTPGESPIISAFAPRVFCAKERINATELMQFGSVVDYRTYLKLPPAIDPDQLVTSLTPELQALGLETETVLRRKAMLGDTFDNIATFFDLVTFLAFLLSCIGVSSSLHFYLTQKMSTVAILRCLGTPIKTIIAIYRLQVIILGLAGAILGTLCGLAVQQSIPLFAQRFLPITVTPEVSWQGVVFGLLIGVIGSALVAQYILFPLRLVSPLDVLRKTEVRHTRSHLEQIISIAVLLSLVFLFGYLQSQRLRLAAIYALGVFAGSFILWIAAQALMNRVRALLKPEVPYVLRQGFSNLFRPGNQTVVMIVALGLSTLFISLIAISKEMIVQRTRLLSEENKPNIVLMDIQPEQRESLRAKLVENGFTILQEAPVVLMRLVSIDGRDVKQVTTSEQSERPRGPRRREYWSTYRDKLTSNERLVRGTWIGHHPASTSPIPISVDERLADRLGADIGSEMVFNIQGLELRTTVSSIREIFWQQMRRNSFFVFPTGVLEDAPQFHFIMTNSDSTSGLTRLERLVRDEYPNVSVIDLRLVVNTVNELLTDVAAGIGVLASFMIAVALLVVGSTLLSSRYQRRREGALLRTIGAKHRQVAQIVLIEYASLGMLGALTGVALSLPASYLLSRYVIKSSWVIPLPAVAAIGCSVIGLTLAVALAFSRSLAANSPLEIMREDGS